MENAIRKTLKKFDPFNALTKEQQDDIVRRTASVAEEQIFDITNDQKEK